MDNIKIRTINSNNKSVSVPAGHNVLLLDKVSDSPSNLLIRIGQRTKVQHVLIFDTKSKSRAVKSLPAWKREVRIGEGAQVESVRLFLGKGNYSFNLDTYISTRSKLESRSIAWVKNGQRGVINDNYIFTGPESYGRFKAAGLSADESEVSYFSDLVIKPKAQKSDSRIDLDFYPLSEKARGRFRPSLKIAANDVKAGHGASSLKLSPQDQFYLRSRGLSPDNIQDLLIDTLSRRFVAGLQSEEIVQELLGLLKERAH